MWGGPDLDFPTLLLLSRHTSTKQRKENSRLSSLAKKKEISVRFSERWRWWRNQGMAAIPSISHLSLIALYSSVLASFPDIFILCGLQFLPSSLPPLSSLCHLQLHRKKKSIQHSTTYHTGSMAMTTGHVQMCSRSDRRHQQAPTPTDIYLIQKGCHSQQIHAASFPSYGAFKAYRGPSDFHPADSLAGLHHLFRKKQKLKIHPLSVTDGAL